MLARWPVSVHGMRVLTDALTKYAAKFPPPPPGSVFELAYIKLCKFWLCILMNAVHYVGKYYVVDASYPNRPGYLSPYRSTRYHVEQV